MDYITCGKCHQTVPRAVKGRNICRPCHNARVQEWRKKNPDKNAANKRRHHEKRGRARRRERRQTDPAVRIVENIRRAVNQALQQGGRKKDSPTAQILGRPLGDFAEWARKQGGIPRGYHIDHIRAVSEFLAKYPDDPRRALREAYHFGNLRIIPARDNWRKGRHKTHLC